MKSSLLEAGFWQAGRSSAAEQGGELGGDALLLPREEPDLESPRPLG